MSFHSDSLFIGCMLATLVILAYPGQAANTIPYTLEYQEGYQKIQHHADGFNISVREPECLIYPDGTPNPYRCSQIYEVQIPSGRNFQQCRVEGIKFQKAAKVSGVKFSIAKEGENYTVTINFTDDWQANEYGFNVSCPWAVYPVDPGVTGCGSLASYGSFTQSNDIVISSNSTPCVQNAGWGNVTFDGSGKKFYSHQQGGNTGLAINSSTWRAQNAGVVWQNIEIWGNNNGGTGAINVYKNSNDTTFINVFDNSSYRGFVFDATGINNTKAYNISILNFTQQGFWVSAGSNLNNTVKGLLCRITVGNGNVGVCVSASGSANWNFQDVQSEYTNVGYGYAMGNNQTMHNFTVLNSPRAVVISSQQNSSIDGFLIDNCSINTGNQGCIGTAGSGFPVNINISNGEIRNIANSAAFFFQSTSSASPNVYISNVTYSNNKLDWNSTGSTSNVVYVVFLNATPSTFNISNTGLVNDRLVIYEYYSAYVNWSNGTAVSGAWVNGTDKFGTSWFNMTTDATGFTPVTAVRSEVRGGLCLGQIECRNKTTQLTCNQWVRFGCAWNTGTLQCEGNNFSCETQTNSQCNTLKSMCTWSTPNYNNYTINATYTESTGGSCQGAGVGCHYWDGNPSACASYPECTYGAGGCSGFLISCAPLTESLCSPLTFGGYCFWIPQYKVYSTQHIVNLSVSKSTLGDWLTLVLSTTPTSSRYSTFVLGITNTTKFIIYNTCNTMDNFAYNLSSKHWVEIHNNCDDPYAIIRNTKITIYKVYNIN